MEDSSFKVAKGGGKTVESVNIPQDLMEKFEALPQGGSSNKGKEWTGEEDALLLRYWPVKNKEAVAKALGVHRNTAFKRYRELLEEENEDK